MPSIGYWRFAGRGLFISLFIALVAPQMALAGLFESNLLGNPGFEDYYTGSGPDWQDLTAVQYNVQTANDTSRGVQPWINTGPHVCAIRSDGPGSANSGLFFGMGGRFAEASGAVESLRQDIDLLVCGFAPAELDDQTLVLSAGAYLSSSPDDADSVAVRVHFYDGNGQFLSTAFNTGFRNVDAWTRFSSVPIIVVPGTRLVRYEVVFVRASGASNDGRIDDAWLRLSPALVLAQPMSERNLACNPGIEQSTGGWDVLVGNPRARRTAIDGVLSKSGEFLMAGGQTGVNGAGRQSIAQQEFDLVRYGFTSEVLNDSEQIWFANVSAWLYSYGDVGLAKLRLELYDQDDNLLRSYDSGRVRANKAPSLFSHQCVVPPTTSRAVLIYDTLDPGGTNIDGYLDDVSLKFSRAPRYPARTNILTAAHRGNSIVAPENTLASLRATIGAAHLAEFDVYACKSGELVVMHDSTVNRTTDGTGKLTDLTLAQLELLDDGLWFSPDFAGEKVPTMAEAIAVLLPSVTPLIEHKGGRAAAYVNELHQLGVHHAVVIQSFDWNFLAQVHALDPTITLGALGSGTLSATQIQQIQSTGASFIAWASGNVTTSATVDLVHAAGLDLFVWTVNSLSGVQQFIGMGVDGIITDHPGAVTWLVNPAWCPADLDVDGDVDVLDMLQLELCGTAAGLPWQNPWCAAMDLDADHDVDQTDFGVLQRCLSGPDTAADPDCAFVSPL